MSHATGSKSVRVGTWQVDPVSGCIARDGQSVRLDGRTMDLLLYLADRAGEVVGVEELLDRVWVGVIVTQDSVYQAVASLRRLLGDDAKRPSYIVTVPRKGYRLVAQVSRGGEENDVRANPSAASIEGSSRDRIESVKSGEEASSGSGEAIIATPIEHQPAARRPVDSAYAGNRLARAASHRSRLLLACLSALCLLVFGASWFAMHATQAATTPARSVAVLPFLDLTSQQKSDEHFADGLTEELIDRLSKMPGMHVPSPVSSFRFKGRDLPVADMAHRLGVNYLLSGSIRSCDAGQRITTRLVRADDGYVLWSQDFDGPDRNDLKLHDRIVDQVAKALDRTIH